MHDCTCKKTVSLKAVITRPDTSQLLVVKNKHGHYDLPGGRSNCSEDLLATLKRELWEEIGLSDFVVTKSPRFAFSWQNKERQSHGVVIAYDIQPATLAFCINDSNIVAFEWVTYEELLTLSMPSRWKEAYTEYLLNL